MNSGEKQLLGRCREAAENPQYPQRPPARGANPWAAPCRAMSAMPMKSIPSKSSRSISSWVGWWAWVLLGAMGRGQGLLAHRVSNTQWHTRGINTLTTSRTFPSRICPGGRGKGQDLTQGPPQAKAPGGGAAVPGHPGVGWVPAPPTWHTGIVGQAGDAPKRHLNLGDVLVCNPQGQAAGLGNTRSLGRWESGSTVPQSHAHAIMPGCQSDGRSASHPPQVPISVGMG